MTSGSISTPVRLSPGVSCRRMRRVSSESVTLRSAETLCESVNSMDWFSSPAVSSRRNCHASVVFAVRLLMPASTVLSAELFVPAGPCGIGMQSHEKSE